jgi:hypothetical protein
MVAVVRFLGMVRRASTILAVLAPLAAVLVLHGPISPPAAVASTGFVLPPVVTAVSPSSVTAGGGATVTIDGADLGAASEVEFGSNESSDFSVTSSGEITATAPVGSGTVNVRVVTPGGESAATALNRLAYTPTGQQPITASGQQLKIGGTPTIFTGVNAYEIATDWGVNTGCGGMETTAQINQLFTSLKQNSIVRFDVFQGTMATNVNTGGLDWAPIDRIFYLAAQDHVYLIPVITAEGGVCDGGHWQDPSWFEGGYTSVFNSPSNSDGTGLDPLSYWQFMHDVVNRYKASPALGLWEPFGEPEASTCPAAYQPSSCSGHQTCPDEAVAEQALVSFFDTVGGEIHNLDPNHLVEAGFLGAGQCGTAEGDYQAVGASPGIDVVSVHDYYGPAPLGGDQYNGMAVRFRQARVLDKPIITGESGILAGSSGSCESFAQRTSDMKAKMIAQFAAGGSAFLAWNWVLDPLGPCSDSTGPTDPLMALFDS